MRYYEPVEWHFVGFCSQVSGSFLHENHGLEIRGMHGGPQPYHHLFCSAEYADEVLVELEIMQLRKMVL